MCPMKKMKIRLVLVGNRVIMFSPLVFTHNLGWPQFVVIYCFQRVICWFLMVIRCWHEDSFREVVEMLHDETKTDLLSQFQACKLVWSIVQKKFFLWWTCHGVVQQDGVGDENPQQCVCFPSEWVGVCLRKYGLIGKSRQKIFRDRLSNKFTHWGNLDISYKNLTLARSLFLFAVFLFGGLQHKDSFKWIFIG